MKERLSKKIATENIGLTFLSTDHYSEPLSIEDSKTEIDPHNSG